MIKKPLEGRTPTGLSAVKAMENLEKVTKVSHLRLTKIIESATDSGAFLFIRLYQETPLEKSGDSKLKMKFANIATKDVKIDTKHLMRVLNEIFSHQFVGFCIKFE